MKRDWLWDRNIPGGTIKKIFSNKDNPRFVDLTALLLSRKNSAKEVFRDFIKPKDFFVCWHKIKRQMRKNSWNDPRIEFWQAIYETLKKDKRFYAIKMPVNNEPVSRLCQEIGEKIRRSRQRSRLTQTQLAKKLKISQQVISYIESGRQNVSLGTLEKICNSLGFSLNIELGE